MAIKTVEKQIGDSIFKINTMNNDNRIPLLVRVTKLFSQSLSAIFGGSESAPQDVETMEAMEVAQINPDALTSEQKVLLAKKAEKDQEIFANSLSKAAGFLVENLDKEDVYLLTKDLFNKSQVVKDNQTVGYNDLELGELFQVIFFIINENFSSVFQLGGIKALM